MKIQNAWKCAYWLLFFVIFLSIYFPEMSVEILNGMLVSGIQVGTTVELHWLILLQGSPDQTWVPGHWTAHSSCQIILAVLLKGSNAEQEFPHWIVNYTSTFNCCAWPSISCIFLHWHGPLTINLKTLFIQEYLSKCLIISHDV